MKRERKIYDAAFKTKAVQLSNERANISELARELGLKPTLLYKWRKEYEEFLERCVYNYCIFYNLTNSQL